MERQSRRRGWLWLVVAVVLGGCSSTPPGTGGVASRPAGRSGGYDVRATSQALLGASFGQVLQAVGRPSRELANRAWEWWTYTDRFYDPITKQSLPAVTVIFHDGKVVDVTF